VPTCRVPRSSRCARLPIGHAVPQVGGDRYAEATTFVQAGACRYAADDLEAARVLWRPSQCLLDQLDPVAAY